MNHLLVQANALRIPLADKSVHICVTSPPYWGLRDYGTAQWLGGDPECDHKDHKYEGSRVSNSPKQQTQPGSFEIQYKNVCGKCGARRIDHQLGLEPTPDEFIRTMVEVFREVWRVLRDDATCWINIGDSYAGSGMTGGTNSKETGKRVGRMFHGNRRDTVVDCKPKDLVGIPWRLAFALQADGWYLRSDIIWAKCLSGGTVVYAKTQKGEMPTTIKDLVRLDPGTVKLWDGHKWNQVVGWKGSQRQGDEIEIELRNGAKIGSTLNHHWPVTWGMNYELVEARDLKIGDVLASCRLPEPDEPREPEMLPPLDIGWFVGLYLAEGSQSDGTIQISGHVKETERLERCEQIAKDYDGHCFVAKTSIEGSTININSPVLLGVIDAYISGRIASEKHLNPRCWKRSNMFLSSILAGYLSGDGSKQTEDRWKLGFCDNDQLAADLRTLGARLGFSVRIRRCVHKIGEKEYPGWRGTMVYRPEKRHYSDYEIVSISPSRARMFWDIALESEPHVFALANGVLTGNSNPMPESVTDRPTKSHEYMFLLSKNERYYFDADAVRETSEARQQQRLTTVSEQPKGIMRVANGVHVPTCQGGTTENRNIRTVWSINEEEQVEWIAQLGLCGKCNGLRVAGNGSEATLRMATEDSGDRGNARLIGEPGSLPMDQSQTDSRLTISAEIGDALTQAISKSSRSKSTSREGRSILLAHKATNSLLKTLIDALGAAGNAVNVCVCEQGISGLKSVWKVPTESFAGAHFATFPRRLVEPCIRAGTSQKGCCPVCGAGWVREVEHGRVLSTGGSTNGARANNMATVSLLGQDPTRSAYNTGEFVAREKITTGWRPGCSHDAAPVPAVVLDPFSGSGTTGVVANALGRSYVGLDLNREYIGLAQRRIARPHAPIPRPGKPESYPLFGEPA